MQNIGDILDNHVLWVAIAACLIAQILKMVVDVVRQGKVSLKLLVGTGGMPSAHSALVTALATGIGQTAGWASAEFAIATVFAVIVMYDASGVRQAAGKQAKVLNQLVDELFQEQNELRPDRLKEMLGHTPFQVLVGSGLGAAISWLASPAY